MSVVTRFAPSPTGRLHLGHAYSALQAFDFARARDGHFLLRIEDIDPGRTREEYVDGIVEDLRWLGIDWDGTVVRQSERLGLYAEALEKLKAMGLVYLCFCTRTEITASAAAPHGDEGPAYPGTCRALPDSERNARKHEPHCWRLDIAAALTLVSHTPLVLSEVEGRAASDTFTSHASTSLSTSRRGVSWHDERAGWTPANPLPQGDIVLARKEAPTSYHLAVTVDDAAQGITDIVRGQDLFAATHVHRLLQALLGLPTPRYHHHALLAGADGQRLAKRHNSCSLADLRANGVDPVALVTDMRAGRLPIGFGIAQA